MRTTFSIILMLLAWCGVAPWPSDPLNAPVDVATPVDLAFSSNPRPNQAPVSDDGVFEIRLTEDQDENNGKKPTHDLLPNRFQVLNVLDRTTASVLLNVTVRLPISPLTPPLRC